MDYRPLIDFCKANNLPVIAANCSRRHSRLMSRQGPEAIERLAEESEIHRNFLLPTLPVQPASQQYEANFRATMGIVGKAVQSKELILCCVWEPHWGKNQLFTYPEIIKNLMIEKCQFCNEWDF